ncbi:hypothetical protein Gpo141_00014616, partial [Globisporangium polare]
LTIPAYFYRISRCEDRDVAFLKKVTGAPEPDDSANEGDASEQDETPAVTKAPPAAYDQVGESSDFLGSLIKASEMWTDPSPSWDEEFMEFKKGLLPSSMQVDYFWYCFLTTRFDDPACTKLRASYPTMDFAKLKHTSPELTYKPDAYWHKFATIPKNARVLVVNGKMDFQTVSDGGVREYENLQGDETTQKMLVEFEFGGHGAGISTTTFSDSTFCGYQIIASFVAQDGETAKVNTTCMGTLPNIDFEDLEALQTVDPGLESVEAFYGEKEGESTEVGFGGEGEEDESTKKHRRHHHKHHHHKHHREHKHTYPMYGNVKRSYN